MTFLLLTTAQYCGHVVNTGYVALQRSVINKIRLSGSSLLHVTRAVCDVDNGTIINCTVCCFANSAPRTSAAPTGDAVTSGGRQASVSSPLVPSGQSSAASPAEREEEEEEPSGDNDGDGWDDDWDDEQNWGDMEASHLRVFVRMLVPSLFH